MRQRGGEGRKLREGSRDHQGLENRFHAKIPKGSKAKKSFACVLATLRGVGSDPVDMRPSPRLSGLQSSVTGRSDKEFPARVKQSEPERSEGPPVRSPSPRLSAPDEHQSQPPRDRPGLDDWAFARPSLRSGSDATAVVTLRICRG